MTSTRRGFVWQVGAAAMLRAQAGKDIFQAAADGDIPRATELTNADPEVVHRRSEDGRTALHYATAAGKPEMVLFLVSHGARLNAGPESPLLAAVDFPEHETAVAMSQTMLGNAADPNVSRRDGRSALEMAAARGYADVIELLIRRGAAVSRAAAEAARGEAAAVMGRADRIERVHFDRRYLTDREGRSVKRDDTNGLPWLLINQFVTIAHSDFEKVKQLMGANPGLLSTRATWDELAIEAAAHVGQAGMAEWLAEKGSPVSTCSAVLLGLEGRVKEALAADRKAVYERGPHDIPVLAYTAYARPQTMLAEMLLKAGANVNARALGATVLHVAASRGHVELAGVLLENGAELNATAKSRGEQVTPLALAIRAKQTKMEQFLRDKGAKL